MSQAIPSPIETVPGPLPRCPSWCSTHLPEIGLCEAAPIPAPAGEVRMCEDPDGGTVLSLYVKTDDLTPAEAEAVAYAILAMTARAKAVRP